jgi:hypothetical protein
MYTINIGLANPFTKGHNTVTQTLKAVLEVVDDITNVHISTDGDEPTVIVQFAYHWKSLDYLCTALDQDCIAEFCHTTGRGCLIGPKASEWGEFNPALFQFIRAQQI